MDWLQEYDRARFFNIRTDSSDHTALFLDIVGVVHVPRSRGFQFENAWLLDGGYREVVEREWASTPGLTLQARLGVCGRGLRRWGGDRHHKYGKRIEGIKKEMNGLRGSRDPSFPANLNDANIVLIPKKCSPVSVSDLRPIALCNVLYKIIANRMKPFLEGMISVSQSAFLPGRLISDNILIASEVGHYLRRKQLGQVGWAVLKLDMAKDYDRMEWPFVRQMMTGLGFDDRWVQLVMMCVQTVRYRVLVSGKPSKEIVPTRGLRKGDPLSPYLFIICAEGLSLLLQDSQAKGLLHGCRVARGAPSISHLFFADDSLLFFKANLQEALEVRKCLGIYESFSGQAVNFQKSSITFSRDTIVEDRDLVANALGVAQADDFGKYLGLPSVVGRNRRAVFAYVEQKLRQRFGSWNKRLLSKAGKEVLLKSVAQAMPTYIQ
ncbi:PREDICTED: uncharacterized protein LOC109162341 [Ipomoea nil]|uniref:uncharacterized protein LOC109162341 n=1 Tax=Ipomoea nil TaxID=35883 RepID=UPI000901A95A|nr:PREDICTED: uncharacterized protein LOC109162341 [Ipomoea nil]